MGGGDLTHGGAKRGAGAGGEPADQSGAGVGVLVEEGGGRFHVAEGPEEGERGVGGDKGGDGEREQWGGERRDGVRVGGVRGG